MGKSFWIGLRYEFRFENEWPIYRADYNISAENTMYVRGEKASYVLLPAIPPKKN